MTTKDQLARWVKGSPIHNTARNECCPDFSCCEPSLFASIEERKQFAAGGKVARGRLLSTFLGRLIKLRAPGKKVRVIGS